MASLVIIDSECANLESVYKACRSIGLAAEISADPWTISRAKALIFPGVGSFAHVAAILKSKGLPELIESAVVAGVPFLGICLGMQLLFSRSEEAGPGASTAEGLGLIGGEVRRFPPGLHVPHVGWNRVVPAIADPLFAGLDKGAYFYFTHSYYAQPADETHLLARTEYGFPFTSAARKGSLYGVQFHPEKSGPAGLRLLANFGKIIADQSH